MRTLSTTFRSLKRHRLQEPKSATPSSPSSSSSSRISKANPSPKSKSSSWFVYLILSTNAPIKTYVGVTNNFSRRLKQHNGELKGGAKASRAGRPWICACLIRGFKYQSEACAFESKWKSISRKLPRKRKSEDMSKQVDNGSRALLQHRQAALSKLQTCSSANLTVSLSPTRDLSKQTRSSVLQASNYCELLVEVSLSNLNLAQLTHGASPTKKSNPENNCAESSVLTSNSHSSTSSSSTCSTHKPKKKNHREESIEIQQFEYSDLEAATNGFSEQKLLGRGSHGCVYKGVLRNGRLVAVKKPSRGRITAPRAATSADNGNEVDNEIDILSKINSPRLVNLVGFTNDFRDRLLVTEFMCNGTLYEVLHKSPRPPNWGRRIKLALQTAKAVDTLHSSFPPVIHRDIKSANVLIDRNFNARLGDFGLALRCHDDDFRFRSTPPAGTIGYLDPGYVTPDNLSTKTDVFSFGILLLEIISGRKAIDIGHSPPSIVDWAIPLIRKGKFLSIYDPRIPPPKDPMVRKQLPVIAAKCVRSCRERRPSMKDIAECLSVYSKMVPLHSWNGLSVSNRCLMVETVGFPLESENTHLDSKASRSVGENRVMTENRSSRSLRNSRRVYSDRGLAFKSNLMDLMAGTDRVSSFRGEADGVELSSLSAVEGFFGQRRMRSVSTNYDRDGVFQLSRNQSVGGSLRQRISCVDIRAVRTQAAKPI
ncbi:hypothetical protein NE237_003728 [Protea cynaroides]|uniref:Protein kinase domain-containing protein n=1 Tax=Protea cynaroides TaxID=273540 RepID=A0A9Q0KI19_9MAGN|nr:hypothetical protein NE237_003728 [Protea cynaroides]